MNLFKRKADKAPISAAATAIVKLLDEKPSEWRFEDFYACHVGGARIWIGNRDLVWSRRVSIPGAGNVVPEGTDCRATRDNKAVDAAVWRAYASRQDALIQAYIDGLDAVRKEQALREQERLAGLDFQAQRHRIEAERAEREASAIRANAEVER